MKKQPFRFALFLLMCLLVASTAAAQVKIAAVPNADNPAIGDTIEISINIAGASNVAGYLVTLTFNPTQLEFISIENSDYLPAGAFVTTPTVENGSVGLTAVVLEGAGEGDGTLAIATFKVLVDTETTVELESFFLLSRVDSGFKRTAVTFLTGATINSTASGEDVIVSEDVVDIPDPNLRAAVETAFGKAPDDPITASDIAALAQFAAPNANITDLTGLESATNLTWLSLGNNSISDISSVVGLTKLNDLRLQDNSISDISPISGLTNLTSLHLGNNSISDISSVAGLTNLTSLSLDNNSISDISPISGLTNLTSLSLGNNSISDILPISGLTNLTSLHLDNNSISDISSVVGLTKLNDLRLQDNAISDILPLVTNMGLGLREGSLEEGDRVDVSKNPLNYASIHTHIPKLQSRGVDIAFNNRTPTTLLKISGDDQKGVSGETLTHPFVVEVRDGNGDLFEGVPVTFDVTAGGGALSVTSTTTDENGRAESLLTLGPNLGTNTVEVSVEGISQTALFRAEATPPLPIPTTLEYVSGNNQSGATGEALMQPLIVKVHDQYDAPMEGVTVTFAVSAGGGAPSPEMTITDVNGHAESTLTLGSAPGTNTVEVSVEGITEMLTFNASAERLKFDLSVPTDISLIHVPLKVTAVDGTEQTIESIADLYDVLGGASTVNFLITYDSATQEWLSYWGASDTGTPADRNLTDDIGIAAGMKAAVSLHLSGNALGTNGNSTIVLNQGPNLVGLPLRDERINRVSDMLRIDGIRGNVLVITLSDGGKYKVVGRAGDPGDIEITGGQSFILNAQRAAIVDISGEVWTNVSGTSAAPQMALTGIEVGNTTPVLGLRGSIVDEGTGVSKVGFRVKVKNLSTDRGLSTVTGDEGNRYQLTFVDIETMRAARIGDILEISAQSPEPFTGVEPLQYAVTAEDVKRGLIQLPELVAYEIPAETELLSNYPNPFNPETWIPYRLAEDAFVTLTIYDGVGQVVRTLNIGHQTAAVYENRSKAIYWNGKNNVGELVASGVYFYHLSAGRSGPSVSHRSNYSATRKMLILK